MRAFLISAAVTTTVAVSFLASEAVGQRIEPTASNVVVPRVVGYRLDRATRTLKGVGLRVNEECGGLLGCIVKSGWWVCSQDPRPGSRLRRYSVVVVYAERRGEC